VVIIWSPPISLAERSRSRFALVVSCVQVRSFFLFLAMPTRVGCGRSKPVRLGLLTGILRRWWMAFFSRAERMFWSWENPLPQTLFYLLKHLFASNHLLYNKYVNLSYNILITSTLLYNMVLYTCMCWLCSRFTKNRSSWSWSTNPSPRWFVTTSHDDYLCTSSLHHSPQWWWLIVVALWWESFWFTVIVLS
jgi:hypothetical protein